MKKTTVCLLLLALFMSFVNSGYAYANEGDSNTSDNSLLIDTITALEGISYHAYGNKIFPVFAHQGYNKYAPNQTMAAYKAAVKHGFNGVECDLKETADGYFVCCHNPTVYANETNKTINPIILAPDDTYTTPIEIANTNLDVLQSYDWGAWKSSEYKGEKILLLDDLVKFCKIYGIKLCIDNLYLIHTDQEKMNRLFSIIDKYRMKDNVYLVSLNDISLKYNENGTIILSAAAYNEEYFNQIITKQKLYPNIKFIYSLNYKNLTPEICQKLVNANIGISIYTIDDEKEIMKWLPYVDMMFSDNYTLNDALF